MKHFQLILQRDVVREGARGSIRDGENVLHRAKESKSGKKSKIKCVCKCVCHAGITWQLPNSHSSGNSSRLKKVSHHLTLSHTHNQQQLQASI